MLSVFVLGQCWCSYFSYYHHHRHHHYYHSSVGKEVLTAILAQLSAICSSEATFSSSAPFMVKKLK